MEDFMYSNVLKRTGNIKDENSYEGVLSRVSLEIYEMLKNVFGPKGNEVFIRKIGSAAEQLYYTRDGKEVFDSIRFSDTRANEIYKIISQGVERQARIGDGTTSAALLMSGIIQKYLNDMPNCNISDYNKKKIVERLIDDVKAEISNLAIPVCYDDEAFKNLMFTTAGDMRFYDFMRKSVPNLDANSIVDVETNTLSSETVIDVCEKPVLRIIPQYRRLNAKKKPNEKGEYVGNEILDASVCLYINGSINLSRETLISLSLLSLIGIQNVILVGASMDKSTTDNIKAMSTFINSSMKNSELANIVIVKSSEYFGLKPDEIVDLNTIFYASGAKNNISQPLDFDHKLYHALRQIIDPEIQMAMGEGSDYLISNITNEVTDKYDPDEGILESLIQTLRRPFNVEMNNEELFLPIIESKERAEIIEYITEQLKSNRSVIDTIYLRKRLSRFTSNSITIKVGSEYLAHSQNDTEILIDSFKAAINALTNGVIYSNGLSEIFKTVNKMRKEPAKDHIPHVYYSYGVIVQDIISSVCEELLSLIYEDPSDYGHFSKDRETDLSNDAICEPVSLTLSLLDNIRLAFDILLSNGITSSAITPVEL
jgi:hypothetical protein